MNAGKPAGARPNRTGDPWQRKSDGRWCARVWPEDGTSGKPRYIYGQTREEVTAKLEVITAADSAIAAGSTPRPKTIRITIDLDQARYTALNRWLAWAAVEASPDAKRISAAGALRAMIDVLDRDKDIGIVVIDWLRRNAEAVT